MLFVLPAYFLRRSLAASLLLECQGCVQHYDHQRTTSRRERSFAQPAQVPRTAGISRVWSVRIHYRNLKYVHALDDFMHFLPFFFFFTGDSWLDKEGSVFPTAPEAAPDYTSLADLLARFRSLLVSCDRPNINQPALDNMPRLIRPTVISRASVSAVPTASTPDHEFDIELVCNYFVRWFPNLLPALHDAICDNGHLERISSGLRYDLDDRASQEGKSWYFELFSELCTLTSGLCILKCFRGLRF